MTETELTKLENLVTELEKCLEHPALPSQTVADFSDSGNVINNMRNKIWKFNNDKTIQPPSL